MEKASKNFKPRGDFVLIKKHDAEEQVTSGGITLPVIAEKMGMCYAEVMAIGPGHYLENGERAVINDLKSGDMVLVAAARYLDTTKKPKIALTLASLGG